MSAPSAEVKPIAEDFAVASQLYAEQIAGLAALGFKSLICNRPDGEAPNEPQFAAISAAAEEAGLQIRYIPVSGQIGLTEENVEQTRIAMAEMPGPILAYCRSGARSAKLYEIAAS